MMGAAPPRTAPPRPPGAERPLRPVLGRAQDGLQVLGQGADHSLDVQPGPLQGLFLHGELVAPRPRLRGQCQSGAAARGRPARVRWTGAAHQLLPQLQDQVHNLHLRLALHPGLDVLP